MTKRPKPLDAEGLWQYALRALGGRAHSAGELREKLRRRAARAEDIPSVIERLKDYGYVSDQRMAEAFAASRLENQGFGKARVVRDLRKRRIAPALAEKAAAEAYRGTDEAELVEAYLRRKYRAVPLQSFLAEPKNVASAYRRLRSAGFSAGASIRVLKRFAESADGLEEQELEDDSRE